MFILAGTYKRSEDETFIDVGFDVNGTKHLDASLGYTRTEFSHGYNYQPKVYLAINGERVAAISGMIQHNILRDRQRKRERKSLRNLYE